MKQDKTQSEARRSVDELWDEALLTRSQGELDWGRLDALAGALAAEPDGWRRVVDVFERSFAKSYAEDDAGWLRCPYVLAAVGQRLDDAGRGEISGYLVGFLRDIEEDEDFLNEVLTEAIGSLGPAALGCIAEGLLTSDPDQADWFSLQHLLELALDDSATLSQRALAIESAERLLRREASGEVGPGLSEMASWALALLGHQPSVGLIEKVSRQWDSCDRGFLRVNEHAFALKHLRGEGEIDERIKPRWAKPLAELAQASWASWLHSLEREEEDRQEEFAASVERLNQQDQLRALLDLSQNKASGSRTSREIKVARNAKCPCGSGRKYKNCCAD